MSAPSNKFQKQAQAFAVLRDALLELDQTDLLELPLSHWAQADDRLLPKPLLPESLRFILELGIDEVAALPGVGERKLETLLKLLKRAASEASSATATPKPERDAFDPNAVSERVWENWRHTARQNGLENTPLGQLAPRLKELPTVLWETPLSDYLGETLAEIRGRKTHGEKRVRSVLCVFHAAHTWGSSHATSGKAPVYCVELLAPLERWTHSACSGLERLTTASIIDHVVRPLLNQLEHDLGAKTRRLADDRLGLDGHRAGVKKQADRLGVTRARLYQIFSLCQRAFRVRWPNGSRCFQSLVDAASRRGLEEIELSFLRRAQDLFFSGVEATDDDEAA